ncbi:MAG: PH domain-containing protein [Acidobacteriia bacterium]|nr:PH domain-containing protein [Terriglobia bacterium]
MIRWLQKKILHLMKVPAEPQPPDGSAGSARVFRSGRNYYRWRLALWFSANLGVLILLAAVSFALARPIKAGPPWSRYIAEALMASLATAFPVSVFFTFLQQRMNYELRWYVVTDRCLRVRSGILNVHEITTTFANIQEVRLSAGPLQKLLGLADVEVHSAGGGAGKGSSDSHAARFEGVDNAPEIRDFILVRLRQYRDSGLGEKDHSRPSAFSEGSLAAAQLVLTEARTLRAALARR